MSDLSKFKKEEYNLDQHKLWLWSWERFSNLFSTVISAKEYLEDELDYKGRIVAVAPYGSMNYALDSPWSDTDFVAVIVPSFEDLVFKDKNINQTYTYKREGKPDSFIRVVSIGYFCNHLLKSDFQMLEVLFSGFLYILPEYRHQFTRLYEYREEIAHYNEADWYYRILGAINSNRKNLLKSIENGGEVNQKNLYQFARLNYMGNFYNVFNYKECVDIRHHESELNLCLNFKYSTIFPDEVEGILETYEDYENYIKEFWELARKKDKNENIALFIKKQGKNIVADYLKDIKRM